MKRREFGSFDLELNMATDDLWLEDEILEGADEENKDSRISIKDLNHIVLRMKLNRSNKETSAIIPDEDDFVYTMEKNKMVKCALDFLRSIDLNLYLSTLKMIIGLNSTDDIKMYNYHGVTDFSRKDKDGFRDFEERSQRMSDNGKSRIYLVLMENIGRDEALRLSKMVNLNDVCTYSDLFKLVHELAHGFDKKNNGISIVTDVGSLGIDENKDIPKTAETYLSETTAILFENLLADYMIKQNPSNRAAVEQIMRKRIKSNRLATDSVGIKTSMMLAYKRSKIVFDERVETFSELFDIDSEDFKESLKELPVLYYDRKYALAELFVPTMIKKYKENRIRGIGRLLEYLEAVKNNDFKGALDAFDITLDKKGLDLLLKNMKEYEESYFRDVDFTDVGEGR